MIQFLDLKNWMNISDAHLEFIEGINLIQGIVGSGKSAVFAAIAYAISDYRRGDTWREYIKTGEKFFEIRLGYVFGNNKESPMVLVIRGDTGRASVSKEASYKGNTYKNSEVDQFLGLKFDLDIMSKVIFNLQGKQPLALMTPTERRDIFKKLFNSDFIDIVEKIKIDKDEIQKSIIAKKAGINALKNMEYPLFRVISVDESELTQLQDELKQAHLTEYLYEKLDIYTDKLNQLNSTQQKIEKAQREVQNYLVREERTKEMLIKIQTDYEVKKNEIQPLIESIERIKIYIVHNKKEMDGYKSKFNIEEVYKDLQTQENKLIELKSEISINKKYLETHKKGKCTECGQDCSIEGIEKFTSIITKFNEEKFHIETNITIDKGTIQNYEEEMKKSDRIDLDYKQEIEKKENELGYIRQTLSGYEARMEEIKEELIQHSISIDTAQKNINDTQKEMVKIQEWLEINPKPEINEATNKSVKDIQAAIDDIQKRIQSNITKAEMNEKSKKAKEKDENTIINLNLEINALESKVNNLNLVNQIYTIDFPSFINMKACKLLESHMNSFFATTKDHFEVALQSDKKGISFYYKSNLEPEWRSLRMVSGFESALSTLGFNVSVARAFGSDMIFLDEPEANADPQTAEKLFETIASIGGFKQLFVITHKENVLPILRYQGAKIYKVKGGVFENNIDY
jgi:exonuclease SbcC